MSTNRKFFSSRFMSVMKVMVTGRLSIWVIFQCIGVATLPKIYQCHWVCNLEEK